MRFKGYSSDELRSVLLGILHAYDVSDFDKVLFKAGHNELVLRYNYFLDSTDDNLQSLVNYYKLEDDIHHGRVMSLAQRTWRLILSLREGRDREQENLEIESILSQLNDS